MGLLQTLALEALSSYFPGLDTDSLRVNLLQGSLDLRDVELAEGRMFAQAGLPFRLAGGSVVALGVHIPWAALYSAPIKLNAHGVLFRFEEVLFQDASPHVADALLAARRGAKKRALAEGERVQSAITVALQKFIPMMLDRVEVNVENVVVIVTFATGEVMRVAVDSFATKTGGRPKRRGNVFKIIALRGLSASVEKDGCSLLRLEKTSFDLSLRFGDGVFSSHIRMLAHLQMRLSLAAPPFASAMKSRVKRWEVAVNNARPYGTVASDPRAWFLYAVRAVRASISASKTKMSLCQVRDAWRTFVEYKRLHVRRLRKIGALGSDEEARIVELENRFSAETILWLRGHARAAVMADEVSEFATKDWLSWALFDHKMSKDREQLAADLRKSLTVAEEYGTDEDSLDQDRVSQNEKAKEFAEKWSQAKLSFSAEFFLLLIDDDEKGTMSLHAENVSFQAVADASMQSYSGSLTVADILVLDEDTCVCCRGDPPKESVTEANRDRVSFVNISLQKPAFVSDATVTVSLGPVCIALNSQRLASYIRIARLCFANMERSPVLSRNTRAHKVCQDDLLGRNVSDNEPAAFSGTNVHVDVGIPRVELILYGADTSSPALVMALISLRAGSQRGGVGPRLCGSCRVSVRGCDASSRVRTNSSLGMMVTRVLVINCDLLHMSSSCDFALRERDLKLDVNGISGFVSSPGILSTVQTISCFTHALQTVAKASTCLGVSVASESNFFHTITATVASVNFRWLLKSPGEKGLREVAINGNAFKIISEDGLSFALLVQKACIRMENGDGHIEISATSRDSVGLKVENNVEASEPQPKVEVTLGHAAVLLKREPLCLVVASIVDLVRALHSLPRPYGESDADAAHSGSSDPQRPAEGTRLSILIHFVRLEIASEETHVSLAIDNMYVVQQGLVLAGSLHGVLLRDLSGLSGIHSVAVETAASPYLGHCDRRAISFNLSPHSYNIHLCSLQFTSLQPFVPRVVAMAKNLSAALRGIISASGNIASKLPASPRPTDAKEQPVVISAQGSGLSFCFPCSSTNSAGLRIETSQITVMKASDGLTFSLRKSSLLTRMDTISPAPLASGQSPTSGPGWTVVLRGLDLDIGRRSETTVLHVEMARHVRHDWKIQVYSRTALFVTPSQVRLLRRLWDSFPRDLVNGAPQPDNSRHRKTSSPSGWRTANGDPQEGFLTSFEHTDVRVETHVVSLELLNEDSDGDVVSTCACLELNPMDACFKEAIENRGCGGETMVRTWALSSSCIRLEDKNANTPDRLREVIRRISRVERTPHVPDLDHGDEENEVFASFKCITRANRREGARSSYELKLDNVRVVPVPAFFARIRAFFEESDLEPVLVDETYEPVRLDANGQALPSPEGPGTFRTHIRGETNAGPCDAKHEIPAAKLSVSLVNSAIQLCGKDRRVGDSALLLHVGSLKTSLLYAAAGNILRGSRIRVRDVGVSITWLPSATVYAEQDLSGAVDALGLQHGSGRPHRTNKAALLVPTALSGLSGGSGARQPLSVPRERLRWNFFRQENTSPLWERLIFMRSGVLQFPANGTDHFTIIVPTVVVDSTMRSLLRFLYVLSVLDLLPEVEERAHILLAPFHISIENLSVRLRVQTSNEKTSQRSNSQDQLTVRLRSKVDTVLLRNATGLRGTFKLSADAVDERAGVRENIISTCELEVDAINSLVTSISVSVHGLLRIVLSPLSARAIACLVLSIRGSQRSRFGQSPRREKSTGPILTQAPQTGIELTLSLRSVALCCVAQEPKMQLLRLALRGLEARAFLVFAEGGKSSLEVSLKDFTLEDTTSWRLVANERPKGESVQWSTIISGAEEAAKPALSRVPLALRLLPNSVRAMVTAEPGGKDDTIAEASTLSSSCVNARQVNLPLCVIAAYWTSPFDHVSANLQVRGLRLNLDMAVIPKLIEWAGAVSDAILHARKLFSGDQISPSARNRSQGWRDGSFQIRLDHMVIEPTVLTIATKAPPARGQESWSQRSITYLFGSESAAGVTIESPKIVFNGDFKDGAQFLKRIRSLYASALTSRYIGRQLFWQTARFSRLARVLTMSYLRMKRVTPIDKLKPNSATDTAVSLARHQAFGLQDALQRRDVGMMTRLRIATSRDSGHSRKTSKPEERATDSSETEVVETLDLTEDQDRAFADPPSVHGKNLFRDLRRRDSRLPKNESFELYAPYNTDQSLLVTSHYIIFLSRPSGRVIEPMIDRSDIAEYHLAGRRLTVISATRAQDPVVRKAARQQPRDTPSLARSVGEEEVNISEVYMHEIECISPQYAAWLHSQLPIPNRVL